MSGAPLGRLMKVSTRGTEIVWALRLRSVTGFSKRFEAETVLTVKNWYGLHRMPSSLVNQAILEHTQARRIRAGSSVDGMLWASFQPQDWTDRHSAALPFLEWLVSPRDEDQCSGRSFTMAVAIIRVACRHPGELISYTDHNRVLKGLRV